MEKILGCFISRSFLEDVKNVKDRKESRCRFDCQDASKDKKHKKPKEIVGIIPACKTSV